MKKDNHLDERRRRDHDDLQNESAGRETGRMTRFLTNPEQDPKEIRKKRAEKATRSLLQTMLLDPLYRARFAAATEALVEASEATERVLSALRAEIDAATQALQEIESTAARLPDGTRVFRDANGTIRRADGSIVEDALAETILWTGDEPDYETVTQQRHRLETLQAEEESVLSFQNEVVGPAQDALNDPDNPPSLEALDEILHDIDSLMPDRVRHERSQEEPVPEPAQTPATAARRITLPVLGD